MSIEEATDYTVKLLKSKMYNYGLTILKASEFTGVSPELLKKNLQKRAKIRKNSIMVDKQRAEEFKKLWDKYS